MRIENNMCFVNKQRKTAAAYSSYIATHEHKVMVNQIG